MKKIVSHLLFASIVLLASCSKKDSGGTTPVTPPVTPASFAFNSLTVNGVYSGFTYYGVNGSPLIKLSFLAALDRSSVANGISFKDNGGTTVAYNITYQNGDSTIILQPTSKLGALTKYIVAASGNLLSVQKGSLQSPVAVNLFTQIDSTDKFSRITDDALLDLVQKQTLSYFTDYAHPVSGMARERSNGDDNTCATGGTGFGIMSIIAGVDRNFLTRADGLARISKTVNFLRNNCTRYHGAFAHWINGSTGATIPFSTNDNGADLVETSFLMEGLLCARQYFNTADATEKALRDTINVLWNGVEWNWFRQNAQNQLYWHWSPTQGFIINLAIKGWDEALITYVLAASSNTSAISKTVYDNGWASNGSMKNGNTYFNIQLPLGPAMGGPLFFSHYSFLGINPNGLSDTYANYLTQNTAHAQINYSYCVNNPQNYFGYSSACWGLTASDEQAGYSAHSPTNDNGTISPTAAVSSLPYTPTQSMNAIKFFYYTLGDKIWGKYGFTDAFSLNNLWFASSYLAIDQGPEIVMIENYRSGLLWNLFTSCPEIKTGMKALGFSAPYL
ncbi:MAG: glucoamylase family protein [Chitinophagaceae bacterium]